MKDHQNYVGSDSFILKTFDRNMYNKINITMVRIIDLKSVGRMTKVATASL